MKNKITYEAAVEHFGGPKKLADALGISRQAVHGWGGVIPELRQYQIRYLMSLKRKSAA